MRLDKLINQGPIEGHGRKGSLTSFHITLMSYFCFMINIRDSWSEDINFLDFEKETVSWLADSEVKNCQICCASFHHFSRRRHHCRLCGSIMCGSCSVFLTFSEARKIFSIMQFTVGVLFQTVTLFFFILFEKPLN